MTVFLDEPVRLIFVNITYLSDLSDDKAETLIEFVFRYAQSPKFDESERSRNGLTSG